MRPPLVISAAMQTGPTDKLLNPPRCGGKSKGTPGNERNCLWIPILTAEFDPFMFWEVWTSAWMPGPPELAELGVEQTVALLRSEA